MKITVVGAGYVGLSLSLLLAKKNEVVLLDIDEKKVKDINNQISPLKEEDIKTLIKDKKSNIIATTDPKLAFSKADFVIIATPTNYDHQKNYFDTSSIELVIEKCLHINSLTTIVIKSTIPIGYTSKIRKKFNYNNIIFSPEFLREGNSIQDNLMPTRIIVSNESDRSESFANLLGNIVDKKNANTPIFLMKSDEAESVKLFANTYLAMRVSFFNELDNFSEFNHLNSKDIIKGICSDNRIGNYYNNPSFGYGGYCLPKDTKQILANYLDIPNNLIQAIVDSNSTRQDFIVGQILKQNPNTVGVYKLSMKKDADNVRDSSILGVIDRLIQNNINVLVYEPLIEKKNEFNYDIVNTISDLDDMSDIIITNRLDSVAKKLKTKIYTRDLFEKD